MDFLIFAFWGVFTGAIICGGTLKKSNTPMSDPQPVREVVSASASVSADNSVLISEEKLTPAKTIVVATPVKAATAVNTIVKEDVMSTPDLEQPEIAERSVPLNITPEEAIQAETYSAEVFDLPEGLSSDQIMLDGEGNPLMHKVQKGEYLTQMARKYYGDYRFWPYILEVNRHLFDSPEKVQADMEIFLPNATTFDINPESPESIDKAKALIAKLVP